MSDLDTLKISIRQGAHLTTNEYVFFDENILTDSEISLTDIIGSSFLTVNSGFFSRRICRLGTVFYLSYLAFEFPQNLALQRFPVGKWIRQVSQRVPPKVDLRSTFWIVSTSQCGELHSVVMQLPRTSLVCS